MIAWVVAVAAGIAVGLIGYASAVRGRPVLAWLALTRAVATSLVTAVALGAPVPGTRRTGAVIGLDVSASWTRAADARAVRAGADTATRLATAARTAALAFGESLRVAPNHGSDVVPADRASRVGALAESAATAGLPLALVTDGEVDDPDVLNRAPAGSRVIVLPIVRGADAALVALDAPPALAPGDTATVTATIAADAAGAAAGRVGVRFETGPAVEHAVPALGPFGRTSVVLRLPIAPDARARTAVVSAYIATSGDREVRNDTLSRTIDISAAPRAVIVSTSPDYDVALALSVLRGALAVPVRAYYRVAPGTWRVAGTLAPVAEADVRAAAAAAGVLLLHGDTAIFGAPRTFARGAVALVPVVPAPDSAPDTYAGAASTPGPLAATAGVPWDSLPPIDVAGSGPDASAAVARLSDRWTGVVARVGRRGPARAIVAGGVDGAGRRIAVVSARGFWRWAFRGGVGAGASQTVWGALFDWLADAPPRSARLLVPADASVRSGAPVHWRGASPGDSVAQIALAPRGSRRRLTLVARRDLATGELRSDSPTPGVYDLAGGGVLVVNPSTELLPRRSGLRSGPIGAPSNGAPTGAVPLAPGWPLALATLLLCAEWLARRRLGLR